MYPSQSKKVTTAFNVTLTIKFLEHYLNNGYTTSKYGYTRVKPENKVPLSLQKIENFLFSNHTIIFIHFRELSEQILHILSYYKDKTIKSTIHSLSLLENSTQLTDLEMYTLARNVKSTKKDMDNLSPSDKLNIAFIKNSIKNY